MPFDIRAYLEKQRFISGSGPSDAKLMIVGDAPNEYDAIKGEPFVGPSGQFVDELLTKAGTRLSQCYKTNVYQKRPPDNKIKFIPKDEIQKGKEYLWSTIRALQPNCILAFGQLALEAVAGKKSLGDYRGSILQSIDGTPKVVATIHPANLIRPKGEGGIGYESRAYVQLDVNRAVQESKTKDLKLPQRVLDVAKDFRDVHNFIKCYSNRNRIAVDIEVKNCIPICVSIAFDPWHAISIPLMNIKEFDPFIPEYQYPDIYEALYNLFQRCEVIGQNWKFDQVKLDRIGLPTPKFYADTMLMAHVLHPELPKGLAFLASIYTREPFYKNELKEFQWGKTDLKQFFTYNAKDSAVTFEVYNMMIKDLIDRGWDKFYFEFQHPLHWLYKEIEETGLKVDRKIQKELWDNYTAMQDKLQKELELLIDHPINIASVKEVRNLLYEELKFPKRYNKRHKATPYELKEYGAEGDFEEGGLATDEETLVALWGNNADSELKKRVIDLILEIRGVSKSKSTYIACEPGYDNRMRWSYKIV